MVKGLVFNCIVKWNGYDSFRWNISLGFFHEQERYMSSWMINIYSSEMHFPKCIAARNFSICEKDKGQKYVALWGKSIQVGRNSTCKDLEAGTCLLHLKITKNHWNLKRRCKVESSRKWGLRIKAMGQILKKVWGIDTTWAFTLSKLKKVLDNLEKRDTIWLTC